MAPRRIGRPNASVPNDCVVKLREKSPRRCSSVGTVVRVVLPRLSRKPSEPPKKKSLFLPWYFGSMTGRPMVKLNWFWVYGGALVFQDLFLMAGFKSKRFRA